jgi:ADP-heptose:LPS heptosyltransferase
VNNPFVDEIILDEAPWWSEKPLINSLDPRYWLGLASRVKQLHRKKYDIAIDFRGDLRHVLLFGSFIKPKYLIGYSRTGGEQLLSISLPYQENRNEINKKTDLLKPLGINNHDTPLPEIFLTREEIQRAESILKTRMNGRKGPFILIDPGAKPIQRWPLKRFATVAKNLSAKWGIQVVISVAPIYKKLGEELIKLAGSPYASLIQGLDLRTLSAVVHLSDLMISCDTGIVHIAKAVGTPTVTLYGPTDPQRFGYQDGRSRIIRSPRSCTETSLHEKCKVNRNSLRGACISAIDEKNVISAANELLALKTNSRFKSCPVQS